MTTRHDMWLDDIPEGCKPRVEYIEWERDYDGNWEGDKQYNCTGCEYKDCKYWCDYNYEE